MNNSMETRIRILLVDDHPFVVEAVKTCLNRHARFEVIGEAANGTEAVRKARELAPDIVLMDIAMPGMNGLEATRCLREVCPQTRVLILTVHEKRELIVELMRSGARGCVRKNVSPAELIEAIHRVHEGDLVFDADFPLALFDEPPGASERDSLRLT